MSFQNKKNQSKIMRKNLFHNLSSAKIRKIYIKKNISLQNMKILSN